MKKSNAIFAPLPERPIIRELEHYRLRALFYDPAEVYNRITVDPYKRHQSISITLMFPTIKKNVCACGCGKYAKQRWHDDNCREFALRVWATICGRPPFIIPLIAAYYDYKCIGCNSGSILELEHTTPVHKGGGGCWLNNYTMMCNTCHKKKTKQDLKRNNKTQTFLFS